MDGINFIMVFQQIAFVMLTAFILYLGTAIPRRRLQEFFEEKFPDGTLKFSQNRLKQFQALQGFFFFVLLHGSGIIEVPDWVPISLLLYSASVAAFSKAAESFKFNRISGGGK